MSKIERTMEELYRTTRSAPTPSHSGGGPAYRGAASSAAPASPP